MAVLFRHPTLGNCDTDNNSFFSVLNAADVLIEEAQLQFCSGFKCFVCVLFFWGGGVGLA